VSTIFRLLPEHSFLAVARLLKLVDIVVQHILPIFLRVCSKNH